MNARKQLLTLSALVFAVTAAMADNHVDGSADATAPLTRSQVEQSVAAARSAGRLVPAGEAIDTRVAARSASTLTRADVETQVAQARADGTLAPAGDHDALGTKFKTPNPATELSRADVNAATLRARAAGALVPAGEAVDGAIPASHAAQASSAKALA